MTKHIRPLNVCVSESIESYFANLEGQMPNDLYQTVLDEIEPALLRVVMKNCKQNQTKAAEVLGLNRSTLRKKLKLYEEIIYNPEGL